MKEKNSRDRTNAGPLEGCGPLWGLILLFSLLPYTDLWAIGGFEVVKIIEITHTKKTLRINLGSLDGVSFDDQAYFVDPKLERFEESFYAAKGQAVKVFPTYSFWNLTEIKDSESLKKGEALQIYKLSEGTAGLTTPKYRRKKIVLEAQGEDRFTEALENYEKGMPSRLIQVKNSHVAGPPLDTQEALSEIELLDLAELQQGEDQISAQDWKRLESYYIKDLQGASPSESQKKKFLMESFTQNAKSHLKKVKDPGFSQDELYKNTAKDKDLTQFREKSSLSSVSEEWAIEEKRRDKRKKLMEEWIKRRGPRWSQEMDDQELSEFIKDHGIQTELERQSEAGLQAIYHEFNAALGLNVVDNSSHQDDTTRVNRTYSLNVGYEYQLVKRYPKLKRFTLELSGRYSKDNLDILEANGIYTEKSARAAVFWYPWQLPTGTKEGLFFFGTGIRMGRGSIIATTRNLEASYTVSGWPTLHAGFKYRFMSGFGYRAMMSIEKIDLNLQDPASADTHPDILGFYDQKIELGLLYSF